QGSADESATRHQSRRDLPWPCAVRQVRQRRRQYLHPQGREEGQCAGEQRDQDLSEREPVLDLRSRRVSQETRLQPRELAREQEFGAVIILLVIAGLDPAILKGV